MDKQQQKTLNTDISRYKKNKLGANLALLGLVFNCLYFMLMFGIKTSSKDGVTTRFASMHIGFAVILTLITLLVAFLSSEGVKGYNKKYCIVLIVLAAFQVIRIFGFPLYGLKNDLLTVNYFGIEPETPGASKIEFTLMLIYLLASAGCFIASAVISYIRSTELAAYESKVQSGEFNPDEFLKELDKDDEQLKEAEVQQEEQQVESVPAAETVETAKEED